MSLHNITFDGCWKSLTDYIEVFCKDEEYFLKNNQYEMFQMNDNDTGHVEDGNIKVKLVIKLLRMNA